MWKDQPVTFDLDSVLDEDEEREPFTFSWDGDDYELPPVRDMRAVGAIAAGRIYDGLLTLLGPEQWTRLQNSPRVLSAKRLRALLDEYGKYIDGLNSGESSASSNSSGSTAGRSKRASKRTTKSTS